MSSLAGRVALVTGAAGDIGAAIARALASAGANVAVHDLELSRGLTAAAVGEMGREAAVVIGDVRDEAAVATFIAQTIEQLGAVDILVNNAGVMTEIPLLDLSLEECQWTIDT